jgi:molecular chaperone DnaK
MYKSQADGQAGQQPGPDAGNASNDSDATSDVEDVDFEEVK